MSCGVVGPEPDDVDRIPQDRLGEQHGPASKCCRPNSPTFFRVSIESLWADADAADAWLAVFLFGSAATPAFQASLARFASSRQSLARSCHHWSGCHASSTDQSTN